MILVKPHGARIEVFGRQGAFDQTDMREGHIILLAEVEDFCRQARLQGGQDDTEVTVTSRRMLANVESRPTSERTKMLAEERERNRQGMM